MKLLQVDTLEEAREKLMSLGKEPRVETVSLAEASGRVLARDIACQENIPAFRRSTVDGYAVRAKDTGGASEGIPVFLKIVEEVSIGQEARSVLRPGECAYVPTGGMLPEGADAMVMVEYSELFMADQVALYASVPVGASVVLPGEDVPRGETLLTSGILLGPAQCGALAAAGVTDVPVYAPWRVSILSTGDELAAPEEALLPGQVRDINTWGLLAFCRKLGMRVVRAEKLADEREFIRRAVEEAVSDSDLVLTSGGSSQGKKDMTLEILDEVTGGGVFTHGLAVKPGKPTILGYDSSRETYVCGLPGHPVAALLLYELLFGWLWRRKTCQREPYSLPARMTTNLAGAPGKTTCQLVKLSEGEEGLLAEPILGKSGLISTMSQADGYVLMGRNQEGLKNGETVQVHFFG